MADAAALPKLLPRAWRIGWRRRRALAAVLVMAAAALLLGTGLGAVRAPIWDEAYYLPAIARLQARQISFATHPPLGLLLIAAGDALHGGNAARDRQPIGAVKSVPGAAMPAGFDYLGPRLAPLLFGSIAAGLFFLLMAELGGSIGAGLLFAPLFLLDTALLAQSRAAHLDPFQLTFVLGALLWLVAALRRPTPGSMAGFAACVVLASLVRANALMLAPMALVMLWPLLRARRWRTLAGCVAAGLGAALAALALVAVLFAAVARDLPDAATPAGRADLARLSPALIAAGGADVRHPGAVLTLAGDYLRFMAADHAAMARRDRNGSHPWQWLLGSGAITYRWDAGGGRVATIALLPNHAAWAVSLAGVLATLLALRRGLGRLQAALLIGWLANMAALLWLDTARVLYLYSYFVPLLLGHALAVLAWRAHGAPERLAGAMLAGVTLCFVIAAPLAFHQPVPQRYCEVLLHDCGR